MACVSFSWNRASKRPKTQGSAGDTLHQPIPDPSLEEDLRSSLEHEEEKERDGLEEWMRRQTATKTLCLEDSQSLSLRRQDEACVLAEASRYREALSKLQEGIELTPNRAVLHELQAQCYLEVDEVFEAVKAAERAVEHDTAWAPGHCTLGRAQCNMGEIELAVSSFKQALEFDPEGMKEVEEDDLPWALELLEKKKRLLDEERTAAHCAAGAGSEASSTCSSCVLRSRFGGKVCLSAPVETQMTRACESDIAGDMRVVARKEGGGPDTQPALKK